MKPKPRTATQIPVVHPNDRQAQTAAPTSAKVAANRRKACKNG